MGKREEKSNAEIAEDILGNKRKFRRAMIALVTVLIITGVVLCVGFWTGEISRIVAAILK